MDLQLQGVALFRIIFSKGYLPKIHKKCTDLYQSLVFYSCLLFCWDRKQKIVAEAGAEGKAEQ